MSLMLRPTRTNRRSRWIGQTLSHYLATAALGAGGMGRLYRTSGQRFPMKSLTEEAERLRIHVLLGWPSRVEN